MNRMVYINASSMIDIHYIHTYIHTYIHKYARGERAKAYYVEHYQIHGEDLPSICTH